MGCLFSQNEYGFKTPSPSQLGNYEETDDIEELEQLEYWKAKNRNRPASLIKIINVNLQKDQALSFPKNRRQNRLLTYSTANQTSVKQNKTKSQNKQVDSSRDEDFSED